MSSFWHWILDNKQWLFSGVAVAVIGYAAKSLLAKTNAGNPKISVKSDSVSTNSPSAIGHVVSQSVNYQFVNATAKPVEGPRQENKVTSPTAYQIAKAIAALPPFQRESAGENYIGLEVCWLMEFSTIDKSISIGGNDYHSLFLSVHGMQPWDLAFAVCEVNLNKYPKLKILHAGQPIWLRGKISSVRSSGVVHVAEPELEILDLPDLPE